jgi:acyl-CoA synthetase (AMP-forming)/AMP-acid ligase II
MCQKDDRAQRRQLPAGDASVLEAAVIGVPDEKWGEVVVAYVQPRPSLTVDPVALEALAARSLSGYKRPTSYVVVEAILKNAVGKIDKVAVRAAHAAAPAAAQTPSACRSWGWPGRTGFLIG